MIYDLARLVDWARNAASDRPRRVRDDLAADGSAVFLLSNDGDITLISVLVDGVAVDLTSDALSLDANVVTFKTAPEILSDVVFTYAVTRYSDTDIADFLGHAASIIQTDVKAVWTVRQSKLNVTDTAALTDDQLDLHPIFQKLIVYRAALDLFTDKANQAADDAIMVKDGDTTIDTSKTSASSEAVMKRLTAQYAEAVRTVVRERFRGVGVDTTRYHIGEQPDPWTWTTMPTIPLSR